MAMALSRATDVRVPRGFGVWLLFLVWMVLSATQLDSGERSIGFVYRALLYVSATVAFLYAYNARALTMRYVSGVLTVFWLTAVVGGYVGIITPLLTVHTPLSYIVPDALQANDLVREMVVRRVTQFEPASWAPLDPRPSAPFLYTNNWGNAYSLLLPFVIVHLRHVRGHRRFWPLALCLPVSFLPAFLTLNRGMFLALGVGAAYLTLRALLGRNRTMLLTLAALGGVAAVALAVLPVADRLEERVTVSSTTEDRLTLYAETIDRALSSPLLGYGAPRPSENPFLDSVGTQGQFWMVLFAHGFVGAVLFMSWLLMLIRGSLRHSDVDALALSAVLVMAALEVLYYGILATGMVLVMVAGAMALRREPAAPTSTNSPTQLRTILRR
ncbi:O-antigen ligase family protein [Georgenia sp. AZ-5]|uniref:O-antigen ligase family protein n=1 Tax=Georgenia sp. AZ-5 TaxID=3367526 RepID=UPI003753FF58